MHKEVSVAQLYKDISLFVRFLIKRWKIYFVVLFIAGLAGISWAYFVKPSYEAELTFVLSSNQNASGITSLASQFGLDLGGNSSDVFSGENILLLLKSRKLVQNTLFRKHNNEFLVNILVKEMKWDKKWVEKERTKNVYPFSGSDKLTPVQDSVLREIYNHLTKTALSISKQDKKTSFYSVITTSGNPVFATFFTRYLVEEAASFYIDSKTKLAKNNLKMLYNEADSIKQLLSSSIKSTGSAVDLNFNLNPALQAQRATAQKNQINSSVLTAAYGEIVKNIELAKITLQKETPLFEIIDIPTLPLKAKKPGKLFSGITAAFIAFIFLTIYFGFKHFTFKTSAFE